jgi:uncharacterized protein
MTDNGFMIIFIGMILVSVLNFVLLLGHSVMKKQVNASKLAKTTRRDEIVKAEMSIKKIWIYPLKSGKRIEVKQAEIRPDGCGLMYDRMFMVVNDEGEMVSQRKVRAMASITTEIDTKKGVARLSAPGMTCDLELRLKRTNETKSVDTKIWRVELSGLDCGKEASDWITSYLDPSKKKKGPYRILRMKAPISRHKDPKYSPMLRNDDRNVFHDGCHMLFANERTAEDLCKIINKKVELEYRREHKKTSTNKTLNTESLLRSCRPNFVVDGGVPYAEDYWSFARIGNVELRPVRPCGRCVMTTVDQDTAKARPDLLKMEPLKTLKKYRTIQDDRFGPVFGLYYNFAGQVSDDNKKISLGDRFRVKSLCTSSVVHASDVAQHYREEELVMKKAM